MPRIAQPSFRERFPAWPHIDESELDSEVDKRLLRLSQALERAVTRAIDDGTVSSFRDFARLVGVDGGVLSRTIKGDTVPRVDTIFIIEHALNTALFPPIWPD